MNNNSLDSQVYTAEDIRKILKLGRTKTYQFLDETYRNKEPFRVIRIGTNVRIPKESFDKWLRDADKGEV